MQSDILIYSRCRKSPLIVLTAQQRKDTYVPLTGKWIDVHTDEHTNLHTYLLTDKHTNLHTYLVTDKHTDLNTYLLTDKHKPEHIPTHR